MIEAVIFDVDGTLIDTVDYHAKAWLWTFARHGHDIPFEDIRAQIGKGGDQLMPVFLPPDEIEHIGKTLSEERDTFFKDEYLPLVHAFPMVRELFERIKADGKRIDLASSAKDDEQKRYEQIARIDDLIEESTSSEDAARSKPEPDIFEAAMARLGNIDPSHAIVIGDTPWDAEAAGKAGLKTIGVLCGGFPESDLREAGCVAIYANPADLLARYDDSPLANRAKV
jgi:phosphoglycolate phosphatase-like HAD superfamily hydrolase